MKMESRLSTTKNVALSPSDVKIYLERSSDIENRQAAEMASGRDLPLYGGYPSKDREFAGKDGPFVHEAHDDRSPSKQEVERSAGERRKRFLSSSKISISL
jgi:hypothetical protein